MHIIDKFETKFLFGLTRVFAMLVILGVLITTMVGGLMFCSLFTATNTSVPYSEVIDLIKPPPVVNYIKDSIDNNSTIDELNNDLVVLPNVKMPFILQKNFNTPEKLQILKKWLEVISIEKQQEFINEMAVIVTETEKLKLSSTEAINKYKELKFKKIETELLTKAERKMEKLYYLGAIIVAFAFIALFSLILVLLAIERNTRRGV